MVFFKKILLVLFFLGASVLSAEELFRSDFAGGGGALTDWNLLNYGEGSGKYSLLRTGDGAEVLLLQTPAASSWIHLIKDFSAAELGEAKKIRLTAFVQTNRPEKISVVLSEGVSYGGAVTRTTVRRGTETLCWEKIEVEMDRSSADELMSAAIGLDYDSAGTYLAVGKVIVTTGETSEEPLPTAELILPAKELRPSLLAPAEALAANLDQQLRTLNPESAIFQTVRNDRSELTRFLADLNADSELSGKRIRAVETMLDNYRQWAFAFHCFNSMTAFDKGTPLEPGNCADASLTLAGNASDGILYLLRNNNPTSQSFVFQFTGAAAKFAKLYQLEYIEGIPDYPREIVSGELIAVPGCETVGILVQFSTRDAIAGRDEGVVELLPCDPALAVRTGGVSLEIADRTLPDVMPIDIFHWDYTSAVEPEKLRFLLDNRVNTFHISKLKALEAGEDFAVLKESVDAIRAAAPTLDFKLLIEIWFVRERGGWRGEYNEYLDRMIAMLESLGLTYDDWFLEIYDETLDDAFLASARAIKEHNPRVRIFSDCLIKAPERIAAFSGLADAWCPLVRQYPQFSNEFAEEFDLMRATDAKQYVYNCDPHPAQALSLYRAQSWVALLNRLDGSFFWTSMSCKFRNESKTEKNYGLTYISPQGKIIPSRRFLLWQTGLEDYLLLKQFENTPAFDLAVEKIIPVLNQDALGSAAESIRNSLLKK